MDAGNKILPMDEDAACLLPVSWDAETDPKFQFSLRMDTLARWGWWLSNAKAQAAGLLRKKISNARYTQEDSRKNYQSDDLNRHEIKILESDQIRFMIHKNELCVSYYSNARKYALQKIAEEIRSTPDVRSILDFGCGAGVNYMNLCRLFPKLSIFGFDYTPKRAHTTGQLCSRYAIRPRVFIGDGKCLSIKSKSIDLTFSDKVLEQIDAYAPKALEEISRITRKKIILIEPVEEYGNIAQKLYMRNMGYVRHLLGKIKRMNGWKITRAEACSTHTNPLRPTGFIILEAE